MRLLLVEDDRMIGESLVRGLGDDSFAVTWVRDGEAALSALADAQHEFCLVILDWNLPQQDGLSVLKSVRAKGSTLPILMVTARDALADRVTGLDQGADDYLTKPFELAELKARLRTLLRSVPGRSDGQLLHGGLVLDPITRSVRRGGEAHSLSAREYSLLYSLMVRPGAILSRAQLEQHLYGEDEGVQSNAIEFVIHGLRRKFGPGVIENIRGVGWRIGAVS